MRTRELARVAIGDGMIFMRSILVAGGAAYVGSMFSRELLARGHRVVVADALPFPGAGACGPTPSGVGGAQAQT